MAFETSKMSNNNSSQSLTNQDPESQKANQSFDSAGPENDLESEKTLDVNKECNSEKSTLKDNVEKEKQDMKTTDANEKLEEKDSKLPKNANIIKPKNVSDKNNESLSSDDEDADQYTYQKTSTPKKGFSKVTDKIFKSSLSNRMEYLSRPERDYLDSLVDRRIDGSLPEDAYPSWHLLPLPTKIPFDQCPIAVTRRNLSTKLFLPPPGEDFDLEDENNLVLPSTSYENLHDPYLKDYVRNKTVYNNLKDHKYITESERVTCSLEDINRYRRYQRRILAAEAQKQLRDEDESFRKDRAKGMEEKIKRDMKKYRERSKTQGELRRWIKNAVASIKDSSMENQRIRDMRVLNSKIRRQKAQRQRVEDVEEKYRKIYAQHIQEKYDDAEKRRRKDHLKYAEKDLDRVEKLCKRQEEERMQKKTKIDEFWNRKSDWQKAWIKKGEELERLNQEEKKKNIENLKRTGRLPTLFFQKRHRDESKDVKSESSNAEESNVESSDEILGFPNDIEKKKTGEKLPDEMKKDSSNKSADRSASDVDRKDNLYDTAKESLDRTSESEELESFKTAKENESQSLKSNNLHYKSADESSESKIKTDVDEAEDKSENDSKPKVTE